MRDLHTTWVPWKQEDVERDIHSVSREQCLPDLLVTVIFFVPAALEVNP